MEKKRFCHLHLHTEYSLLDSSAKIKKVIAKDYKEVLELVKSNEEKKFTYTEFEILQLLAQNPGRVFSKEQIYDIVWNEPYSGDYNIVMSHISHIREKIEDDPSHPVYIQTVWGVGYKFNEKMCE